MIREKSCRLSHQSPKGSFASPRLPLVALITATSIAALMACGSDDDDGSDADEDVVALENIPTVEVPVRDTPAAAPAPAPPGSDTPNGLALPDEMLDWRVIGVVNVPPTDMAPGTLRVIVGNSTAVTAARSGQTNPWPDGSMIGHFQWGQGTNPDWDAMVAPGDFARLTMMVKNSTRYAADGGWAYGVWAGEDLIPPAAGFDRACVNCHTSSVPQNDYVFTVPAELPSQDAIDDAPTLSNDLSLPSDILDWRVIGAASRETDDAPNIRVIVGNDIAVEAARSGETNPWPDGAMLAHYVWGIGDNANTPDTINAVTFSAFTLMVKNAGDYEADGGWAYGAWSTLDLNAPPAADFDRDCVACHTSTVGADNDFVFTRPGVLPTDLFGERPQNL